MHQSYDDIRDKLGQPLWWDECGVPRYVEFHPTQCNNIYANEAALLDIACQECHRRFLAAETHGPQQIMDKTPSLTEQVKGGLIHYGDPPNANCCPAGPTMNCLDLHVVQFWSRRLMEGRDWTRVPDLEIMLPDAIEVGVDGPEKSE